MASLVCKMCGGNLVLQEGMTVAECEYCGTKQTVPKADDEKKIVAFSRANRMRAANEFDKAAGLYESIIADFPEEAEAYWGLVLCRYGIEYVDDPATGKKIPTCHRSSFSSILEDADYKQTVQNADVVARDIYREEAEQIETLRKGIIEVSSKEAPYDIFICYKETDETGERTIDSLIAQDVYDTLTEKGYRVFFSRVSLEDKLGQEYEPYIFAALNSAKIMLAFGTDETFFNAVWVKNEWSRFLQLIASGQKKTLIPCYKGIDPYDMPKEFAKLQAQDMGKVGALQDLLRGIEKILPIKTEVVKETVVINSPDSLAPAFRRAQMLLDAEDWDSADACFERILDQDPENAHAYIGKLLAELECKKEADLGKQRKPFNDHSLYRTAIKYADSVYRQTLEGYLRQIADRIAEETYQSAQSLMKRATSAQDFLEAKRIFQSIADYKDSKQKAKECDEKAINAKKDDCYRSAKAKMQVGDYESAISLFQTILDWSDSAKQIEIIVNSNNTYHDAVVKIRAKQYEEAIELLQKIVDWQDSRSLIEHCKKSIKDIKTAKKRKKRRKVVALCLVVLIAFVAIWIGIIEPFRNRQIYQKGVSLFESGKFEEAYQQFQKTNIDSPDYIIGCMIQNHPSDVRDFLKKRSITELTIPYGVTSIGDYAFYYCSSLKSITIPSSVTSIGDDAFYKCSSLKSITIPEGVTSIGDEAFSYCGLTSITIPDSVTSIGNKAFYYCSSLTSITVDAENKVYHSAGNCVIETASKTLIAGCENSVIPTDGSVTSIGDYAFDGCSSLTSITIPSSVTSVGDNAFSGCTNLEKATIPTIAISSIPKTNLKSVIINGGTSIDDRAFYECSNLTSITIPDSVTSIGDEAFSYCGLTSITIPDSVTSIGSGAFLDCRSLTSITVDAENKVYHSAGNCLIEIASKTLIVGCKNSLIPADGSVTSIGDEAFSGCSSLTNITIPSSVTSVGDNAFSGCTNLEKATIPTIAISSIPKTNLKSVIINGGTSIDDIAFYECSNLTSITIPSSVTSIGDDAFYKCSSLKSITIPEGVTSIGKKAFYKCSSLTSITIPSSVTSIGDDAFRGCNKLIVVCNKSKLSISKGSSSNGYVGYYAKNIITAEKDSFLTTTQDGYIFCEGGTNSYLMGYVGDKTDLVLPQTSPTGKNYSIYQYAFYDCSSLKSITIPDSVTSIGEHAFYKCSSLKSITIGKGVMSIGSSAFSLCSSLTSITIPSSVTSIGSYAFDCCSSLTSITIPSSVTSIGSYAFYKCSSLKSITIGKGVMSIGSSAFSLCSSLTSITIPSSVTSIGNKAFYDCSSLKSITIPSSVTSIGSSAFYDCSSLKSITFQGYKAQWEAIRKDGNWNYGTGSYVVHCIDGDIKE